MVITTDYIIHMDTLESIMSLISTEDLALLAQHYGVNRYNNKLTGEFLFKGLMRLILLGKKTSLRMLANLINQGIVFCTDNVQVSHSGISKRLKIIQWEYFEGIYKDLLIKIEPEISLQDGIQLHRFDSTIINLSGYLIKDGLKIGGKANDSQIKVTIGLRNTLPSSIRFCQSQSESSENIALIKAINEAKVSKEDILLFDRGINKTASFVEFEKKDYKFITRVVVGRKYKIVATNQPDLIEDNTSTIIEDLVVNLYDKEHKCIDTKLRLVKLLNKDENEIWFLTNLFDMPALEVTKLYKRRWDIEVFFKFIKQNLGYKHFLSHSLNGMKVYIYMILITALLFLVYKIRKQLEGFKIPLFQFNLDLEKSFIKTLIILAGGNFDAVKQYF